MPSATGGFVPSIDTREITTQVLVNDGQTVVLGGILETERRDTVNKVPYLGDIPGLGVLFRSKSRTDNKDELLIFVTPKILREGARPVLTPRAPGGRICGRSNPAAAFLCSMPESSNVFLVGPMGSGKSAVGRQLARLLALEFIDADAEIERRTGVDISYIFEREGEPGFRQREAAVIDELTQPAGIVLATGGGAVLDPRTRDRLRERGRVVYLRTSVNQQLMRTRHSSHRPLLANPDPRGTLERLMAERAPLYEDMAAVCVDTDGRKVKAVVEEIVGRLSPGTGA